MNNYQRTADWLKACGKEPNEENLSLQIACHIEEFCEFLYFVKFSGFGNNFYDDPSLKIINSLDDLSVNIKNKTYKAEIIETCKAPALDALCDMEVTGNGIAYLAGFNKVDADQAVLDSNDAKLVNGKPVILPSGKIGKPEGWVAPDLSKFV